MRCFLAVMRCGAVSKCVKTGLMGDTSFAKGVLELQRHIPLFGLALGPEIVSPVSLSLCASGGAIR